MKISEDKFEPEYIVEVYRPQIRMEGFLVIDNTALGPGKGGIRMTPDVTKKEVWRGAGHQNYNRVRKDKVAEYNYRHPWIWKCGKLRF